MKNEGKAKKLLSGYTVYLLVLLVLVLLYYVLVFPAMNSRFTQLDAQYNTLQMQNDALSQYEGRTEELAAQTKELQAAYEADTSLKQPTNLSNLISQAADESGSVLLSANIGGSEAVTLKGYDGEVTQAEVRVEIPAGGTPALFLQAVEQFAGAGFYVTQMNYDPEAAANLAMPAAAEDGAVQAAGMAGVLDVTLSFYTIKR